jgi:uncharacterized protein (DUF1778 family)
VSGEAEHLHLHLEPAQKALIETASASAGSSVSSFVISAALETAANLLADRHAFALASDDWRVFDDALDEPPDEIDGLTTLLAERTVLDEDLS